MGGTDKPLQYNRQSVSTLLLEEEYARHSAEVMLGKMKLPSERMVWQGFNREILLRGLVRGRSGLQRGGPLQRRCCTSEG